MSVSEDHDLASSRSSVNTNDESSGRLSPSPSPTKKSNGDGEEMVKLKHRLRAETVQKDSIAAEMQRLRLHLTEVEGRGHSHSAAQHREQEMLEVQLHEAQREAKEATKQLRAATEQADELDRQLMVERERSQALEQEHQRVMIERHDQATNDAEIEESQLRLKQMEAENRSLARQLDDRTKQSDFAREAQREAARNAIEIQEKLDATERKLEEERKRKQLLTNECQTLRSDLAQAKRDAAENGAMSSSVASVPRLSLNSFKPAEPPEYTARERGESQTFVHFSGTTETPRPGYGHGYEDGGGGAMEMQDIPQSQQHFGSHRRSNSLDSLASDAVPLTEAPDGRRTGDPDKPEQTEEPKKKKEKQACPCIVS